VSGFGKELLFYFDAKKDFTYPSPTLGALFPNVVHCPVTAEIFVNPDVPHDKGFRQGRLPGAITGVDGAAFSSFLVSIYFVFIVALAGFPSLYTLKFKSELAMYGVVIFDQQSRSESHVLTLLTPPSVKKRFLILVLSSHELFFILFWCRRQTRSPKSL